MNDPSSETLSEVLARHHFSFAPEIVERLARFCHALWQWNEKINLTRHLDYERFVSRDVMDSWQLVQLLQDGEVVLDVGSGGGVPGLVMAILRPDLSFSVCESVGKKARVLEDLVRQLDLSVPVYPERAEAVLERHRFTTLTARAVGSIRKMCQSLDGHWSEFERLLLVKGPGWVDERGEARHFGLLQNLELRKLASYPMPGTESDSVILQLRPKEQGASVDSSDEAGQDRE
ncbi:MAG: Ribosomal small subunit methyltransferase [Planctomycetota bacterium]